MSTTANEIWLGNERLDLDAETLLLPTFQANDRTKPDTIQSDYSPEFSAPGTAKNHRLLGQAAQEASTSGAAYARLPAMLTSGGVETMPLALLYLKGYEEGRYQLQLVAGNRRLVEALGEKKLADLDLSRFNHTWTPANVAGKLSYAHWAANGYGYEVYDRGKPLDPQALDPFTLYPSVAARLVWQQLLQEAGFTADSLLAEPLFAALNVPTATPFVYSEQVREASHLAAGWRYQDGTAFSRTSEYAPITFPFNFTSAAPFAQGAALTFVNGRATVETAGYYAVRGSLAVVFGCEKNLPGEVSMKVFIAVNGAEVGTAGYERVGEQRNTTLAATADHLLLSAGDVVEIKHQGDEWPTAGISPTGPYWRVGYVRTNTGPPYNPALFRLEQEDRFELTLLEEFPHGGLVRLQDWLPDMKQLDFFKTIVALLGLTVQTDAYRPHLRLTTGAQVLANAARAPDWTAKRDAARGPLGIPERKLVFRFGDYAQRNTFAWAEDETVTTGYGNGVIAIADTQLEAAYDMVTLPFAASEASPALPGFLLLPNYKQRSVFEPDAYDTLTPKPRLTLRADAPTVSVQVIITPAYDIELIGNLPPVHVPAVLQSATTTPSYFAGPIASLATVLPTYWPDLAGLLKQTRALTERYRLTPQDVAALDFGTPIWDGILGGFYIVSKVSEYDAARPVEVELARLHPAALPAPSVFAPDGLEFFTASEFYAAETY